MTPTVRGVRYDDGETTFRGYIALDDDWIGQRPGVLLFHGGAGIDDHAKAQARRYASIGYVAFACDMFGEEITRHREQIVATIMSLRDDRKVLLRRGYAALTALGTCEEFNGTAAAIGFCFGGLVALELARGGLDVRGVVSVHGALTTSSPAKAGLITAKVLVCHGALDPYVTDDHLLAFIKEMNAAGSDWQLIVHGGARHAFTHKTPPVVAGNAYHASADRRSFVAIQTFLSELFNANSAEEIGAGIDSEREGSARLEARLGPDQLPHGVRRQRRDGDAHHRDRPLG